MPMSIGDINFGVDADTAGLMKAVDVMKRFGKEVDEVAASQVSGAKKVANAMSRQESAMKRSFNEVVRLRGQMKQLGAKPAQLADLTNALRSLDSGMKRGKLSTIEYTRVMDAFNTRVGRSRTVLNSLKMRKNTADAGAFNRQISSLTKALGSFNIRANKVGRNIDNIRVNRKTKELSRFNMIIRDLESASVLAVGPLSGLGARIRSIGSITSRSTIIIAGFFVALAGVAVAVSKISTSTIRVGKDIERMNARFKAITGSMVLAKREFKFIDNLTGKLAINLKAAAEGYSRLMAASLGTNLEGQKTRDIFEGVAMASSALRLTADQTTGALRAIEQMMSKGTVQAEELRGQLGERIPGAFRLAAEAVGVTTAKLNRMLRDGKIITDKFLPKFGKVLRDTFGDEAAKNIDSIQGKVNLLSNEVFKFNKRLDEVVNLTGRWKGVLESTKDVVNSFTDNIDLMIISVGALAGALIGLSVIPIVVVFVRFMKLVKSASIAMLALNTAIFSSPIGRLAKIIFNVGIALVGAAVGFKLMEGAISDASDAESTLVQETKDYIRLAEKRNGVILKNVEELRKSIKVELELIRVKREGVVRELELIQDVANRSIVTQFLDFDVKTNDYTDWFDKIFDNVTTAAAGFFGFKRTVTITDELTDSLDKLNLSTSNLKQSLLDLSTIAIKPVTVDFEELFSESAQIAKKLQEVIDKNKTITEITTDIKMGKMSDADTFFIDAIQEARSIIESVAEDELPKFAEHFKLAGESAEEWTRSLTDLLAEVGRNENEFKKLRAAIEKTPVVLKKLKMEMELLALEAEAFSKGMKAATEFKALKKNTIQIAKMHKELEDIIPEYEKRNELIRKYIELLDEVAEAEKEMEERSEVLEEVTDALGDSIEDAILSGEKFSDVLRELEKELARIILRQMILNPLMEKFKEILDSLGKGGEDEGEGEGEGIMGWIKTAISIGSMFSGNSSGGGGSFAHGGSFKVGGVGGTDSQLVSFMASPDETVTVATPSQRQSGGYLADIFRGLPGGIPTGGTSSGGFLAGIFRGLPGGIPTGGTSSGGFLTDVLRGVPGFARGGSFKVGGSGGSDSQLVSFKASPQETVTVATPSQQQGGGDTININYSPVIQAIDTQSGLEFLAENKDVIVGLVNNAYNRRGRTGPIA